TGSSYDARGLLESVTEAADTPVERTTKYGYDAAGSRTVEWRPRAYRGGSGPTVPGEPGWDKVVIEFNAMGRAARATEGAGYLAEGTETEGDYAGEQSRSRRMG